MFGVEQATEEPHDSRDLKSLAALGHQVATLLYTGYKSFITPAEQIPGDQKHYFLIPSHTVMKNHPNWKAIICGVKASDQIL